MYNTIHELMQKGDLTSPTTYLNEDGENVVIKQGHTEDGEHFYKCTTYQSNGWIRINIYYESGISEELFDGSQRDSSSLEADSIGSEVQMNNEIDCNTCRFISMTEEEQRSIHRGNHIPHMCKAYGERLKHLRERVKLHPCSKCNADNNSLYTASTYREDNQIC